MPLETIAVTGATGALGTLALDALRARGHDPVPLSRRHGPADYDDPASLLTAFTGVDRLLFVSSPELDPHRRSTQHLAVVEAARAARVSVVVYTGFHPIDGLFAAHKTTEEALAASGIAHTVLRNPFYSEPFAAGTLVHATGGRPLNTATRADLAEAAAVTLLSDEHSGRVVTLTGPLWTYAELAAARGEPAVEGEVAPPMGWLHGLARAGTLATQTPDLARLLGRPPTPITAL